MVGRNAPCPCGSGKKYKRCCVGANEEYLDQQVELELNRILLSSFEAISAHVEFADFEAYSNVWKKELEGLWNEQEIEEAISAYYILVARRSLWTDYIRNTLEDTLRNVVRSVVKAWKKPIILLGTVKAIQDGVLEIEELLGTETYLLKKNDKMVESIGAVVYGIVLPDNRKFSNGVGIVSSLMMIQDEDDRLKNKIEAEIKPRSSAQNASSIEAHMLDIYAILLGKSIKPIDVEKAEEVESVMDIVQEIESAEKEIVENDLTPIQQEVIALVNAKLVERNIAQEEQVQLEKICSAYFKTKQPNFRKANVVAAAAFQTAINLDLLLEEPMTNSAAAKLFDVSPASMTSHMNNLRQFILEDYSVENEIVSVGQLV